ncbi:MAG TPA: AzlC family ABC transporter permease [Candidatus Limnocylindrales bacterium]|nr:AzlC family ABC transporter permease [Candidatus Limnocylindrales bacterium]
MRRDLRKDLPALKPDVPAQIDAAALGRARRRLTLDGLGIIVSATGFGFVFGLTARTTGHFSPIEAMAMSVIAFAGAAQFAAVGYVAAGLSWPAIGLLTFLLNARHILYSAALAPWFRGRSFVERAVAAHLLTDEAFALSIAHFRRVGRFDAIGYWYGAIVTTLIPWNVATFAGVMLGDAIVNPQRLGIDVISPAAMGGLAIGLISGRRELAAAFGGAAIGVAASLVSSPTVGIIAGGLFGPLVGLLIPPAQAREVATIGSPESAGRYGVPRTPGSATSDARHEDRSR